MNSKFVLFSSITQQLTSGCTGQISAVTFCAKTRTKIAIKNLLGEPGVRFTRDPRMEDQHINYDHEKLEALGRLLFLGIRDAAIDQIDSILEAPFSVLDEEIESFIESLDESQKKQLKRVVKECANSAVNAFLHELDFNPNQFGDIAICAEGKNVIRLADELQGLMNNYDPWLEKGWSNEI